jgi:nucleotide-binding universal stress UspA family protein
MIDIDDIDGLDDLESLEPSGEDLGIRRILVALDASSEHAAALEAAADLAALLEAELAGLFVEEPDLVRLEGLSQCRKITLPYGPSGGIEEGSIQRELQVLARRTRDALARASEQRQVPWSFEVTRGPVEREVASAASNFDLVIVESKGRRIRAGVRMDSSTRRAAHAVESSVLFLKDGAPPTHSIVFVYDGTEESQFALEAALQFAGGPLSLLSVLFPTRDEEEYRTWREEIESRLTSEPLPVHYRRIAPDSIEWLQRAVDNVEGDLLIQSAHNPILQHNAADAVLESLDCPVFLIR